MSGLLDLSYMLNSSVFFQFLWPLLGKIAIWQNILHLFPHNMFRGLASCSRGGFEMTDNTFQQTKDVEVFCPQKVKVGTKDFNFFFFLNWTPMGFLLLGAARPSLSPSYTSSLATGFTAGSASVEPPDD